MTSRSPDAIRSRQIATRNRIAVKMLRQVATRNKENAKISRIAAKTDRTIATKSRTNVSKTARNAAILNVMQRNKTLTD